MILKKVIFAEILLILITIFNWSIVLCAENKVRLLEDKILLNASINNIESSNELLFSFAEIDNLSVDEAIDLCVRLSDYYLGEGGTELYLEKTTKIGEKILPFLIQKKNMPTDCNEKYKKLCRSVRQRNYLLGLAIKAIKEGIIIYSEYPAQLSTEAKKYLRIIDIFLEDYKRTKNHFPKDLHVLREYACREYGYKLRVLNPWGAPYKYVRLNNEKYVLEIGSDNPVGKGEEMRKILGDVVH